MYAENWERYVEAGLVPLPTTMTGKGAGKSPAMKWEGYQERPPTRGEYERFAELHGDANIGTVTGKVSGVFVLDFDRRKGHEDEGVIDGVDYFQLMKERLPVTPVARTGGGGYHVYFRHPGGTVRNKVRAARNACVDVRGDGGFIVLPPSRKEGGGPYEWLEGLSPFEVAFADPPEWVLELVNGHRKREEARRDMIPEGYRNDTLFRIACSLRNQGFEESYILDQMRITNRVNAERGGKLLDERELRTIAAQAARYKAPKQNGKGKDEVERVLSIPGKRVHVEEVRTDEGLRLLVRQDGEFSVHERFGMYVPDDHSAILEGVVALPTGVDGYGSPTELWEEVVGFIRRYIDLGGEAYERLYAAYVMLSWLYPQMPVLPMASFIAPMGSAKTRALDVVGGLCYHACTMVFPTEQVIYRVIDRLAPTICFEEQTVAASDREQPFIRVLNAGLQKGARVPRCASENYDPGFYDIFCPKVLAKHEYYDDAAFESRCITCRLSETVRKDIPIVLTDAFRDERDALIRKLCMWRFDYVHRVGWDVNGRLAELREATGASFRTLQVYSPFLALSRHIEGLEETLLSHFAKADEQLQDQKTDSATGIVVQALVTLIRENADRGVTLEDMVITPGQMKAELEQHYGGEFTATRISRTLKPLGIVSKPRRVSHSSGAIRCYVLDPGCVRKAMESYLERPLHFDISEVSQNVTVTEKSGDVTHVTLCTDTLEYTEKNSKIGTNVSIFGGKGGSSPSWQKCNRQSVTGNVTQSVTGNSRGPEEENPGHFTCAICGERKELRELCMHDHQEVCMACYDTRLSKYKRGLVK
jgi:hypothetical protein